MRWWIEAWINWPMCFALCCGALHAGPVEFGMTELNAAIDARNFKYKPKVMAELNLEPPETFRIEPYAAGGGRITGGDLRGLMYGLLEAAGQMRSTGHLKMTHGVPALALRGIRITARPDAAWFASSEFWQSYFDEMARGRFNRLEISFDAALQSEALPALRNLAQIGQQYGVEVAVGLGAPSIESIQELLRSCPLVKAVALRGEVARDAEKLLAALHDAGRRVVLELPDNEATAGLIEAAGQSGAPLRLFSEYTAAAWNPRPRDSYWEMVPAQGADAVNAISGAGFEVAAPVSVTGDETLRPSFEAIEAWGRQGFTRPTPLP